MARATGGVPRPRGPVIELNPQRFAVEDLRFDDSNPRLKGDDDEGSSQQELFEQLWRDFAVDEVAASIAANGYFPYEPMFVADEDGEFVVVEGNRRLAAAKALLGQMKLPTGSSALPKLTAKERSALELVPCLSSDRSSVWQYIGFKHVNGPQAWQSASKAEYIAWVHNDLGVPLAEIARRIGDKHATVQRLYRALMVIKQAESADVFHRSDRAKEHFSFSHLYTGLDYSGISNYIKVVPTAEEAVRPVPKSRLNELGELCVWLYGSKSQNKGPVVSSQNPDLRILDEVLHSKDAVAALRQGLPLRVSQDIGKGDTRLLREALVRAKDSLQTARGRVLTGFKEDEGDIVRLAEDAATLADALYEELLELQRRGRRGRRRTTATAEA